MKKKVVLIISGILFSVFLIYFSYKYTQFNKIKDLTYSFDGMQFSALLESYLRCNTIVNVNHSDVVNYIQKTSNNEISKDILEKVKKYNFHYSLVDDKIIVTYPNANLDDLITGNETISFFDYLVSNRDILITAFSVRSSDLFINPIIFKDGNCSGPNEELERLVFFVKRCFYNENFGLDPLYIPEYSNSADTVIIKYIKKDKMQTVYATDSIFAKNISDCLKVNILKFNNWDGDSLIVPVVIYDPNTFLPSSEHGKNMDGSDEGLKLPQ